MREPRIERDDVRWISGRWWLVYPARPGEGMGTVAGPFLTRTGARFSRWLWS